MNLAIRAFAVLLAISLAPSWVFAQNSTLSPFPASGVPVGKPLLTSIGQNIPPVATKVGQQIGYLGLDGKPVSTERPPGTPIDMRNLAAPLPAPLAGDTDPKSVFDKLYDKWRQAIGLSKPTATANTYTPGLSRRNRERRNSMWRWD